MPRPRLTLQSELDPVHRATPDSCFKAGSGETTHLRLTTRSSALLNFDDKTGTVKVTTDDLGFKWLVVTDPNSTVSVTRIHGANTTMVEHGLGTALTVRGLRLRAQDAPG